MATKVSDHFTATELNREGATLPAVVQSNLARLARELLEPLRAELGVRFIKTSAYRSPSRNAAVDGSKTSQHMDGTAADFTPEGLSLFEAARRIDRAEQEGRLSPRSYGQLIFYPFTTGHMHISLPTRGKFGEKLVKLSPGESEEYGKFDLATFPRWHRTRERGAGSGRAEATPRGNTRGCCA